MKGFGETKKPTPFMGGRMSVDRPHHRSIVLAFGAEFRGLPLRNYFKSGRAAEGQ